MSQPDRIEFITELVTPLAASLGLAVWGVELGGAARPIARFYVDVLPGAEPAPSEKASDDDLLPQGVTIDQCAELSRLAGLALDVEDPFATNWTLEISSPGLQRPFFKIDQLRNYVGRELEVVLAAPLDTWPGRKKFSGVLAAVADEEFTLSLPDTSRKAEEPEEVTIAWPFVRKATLVHHFPEPGKKLGGKKDCMNLELKKAIDQISKDKGLDRDMLVDTLEDAVRTSVIRKYGENIDVEVSYNDDTGEIQVHQFKIVVDDVADPDTEIDIEKARELDPSVQLDDEIGFPLKVTDLGRIAAQSAKQVIIQRMRDAEQELIYEEFKDRVGEICSGIIQRRDKGGWIINLGRTEAILPKEEQIPREHYKRGDRVQALIIEVKKEGRGPQIVISRSHRDYTAALFRREVPEVDDGTVQIMGVARDPGSRAKVAVLSRERDVDPVGACVGVRGSRIQNIVQELHGERIDIVVWSPEISTYARNALAPAVISRIVVDEAENLLEVTVPDDQLTSAIGRKGQNVKLAAKLLGWKIDIFTETRYNETNAIGRGLEQVASVAEVSVDSLVSAGFTTLEQLQDATDEELSEKLSLSDSRIGDLRAAINFLSPVVGESADKADADADKADETAAGEDE